MNPIELAWYSKKELGDMITMERIKNKRLQENCRELLFALQEAVEMENSLTRCGLIADTLAKAEGGGGK